MTINSFDLYLANRIQEKERISIDELSAKTERSTATIRRSIQSLNEFLAPAERFLIMESTVISQLSYQKFIHFIQSLQLTDFATSVEERLELVIVSSVLKDYTNLSQIYEQLLISQSTKKRDRAFFLEELTQKELKLESSPGKGIRVTGDELRLRIVAAQIINKVVEISNEMTIVPRKANSPLQNLIFQQATELFDLQHLEELIHFLKANNLIFNYTGKKFLYLYVLLSYLRISQQNQITTIPKMPAPPPQVNFFSSDTENFSFSCLLASLDNNGTLLSIGSEQIHSYSNQLIDFVEHRIITDFYTRDTLQQAIEQYLSKCLFRVALGFDFYDNKLEDVKNEFSFLYQLVAYFYETTPIEHLQLDTYQVGTLTLLFREHVLKNKIAGRNRKKIVLVTNSAKEKSDFFAEQLTYYFDAEVLSYLDIQELNQLETLSFDNLITFSNRLSSILDERGYPNVKLNYYFHDEDIQYLIKLNFSLNSHRKLVAEEFCSELEKLPSHQVVHYLKVNYPNFFV